MNTALFYVLMAAFAVTSMVSLGLTTEHGAVVRVLKDRGYLLRSLLVSLVIVPAIGALVLRASTFDPAIRAGIMLMTLAPGGVLGLQFTTKSDAPSYALATQFLLAAVGLVLTPFLATHLLKTDAPLHLPFGELLALILASLCLPLALGRLLQERFPERAPAMARAARVTGTLCFVVAFLVMAAPLKREARHVVGSEAIGAMVLIIALSMAVGWFVGGRDTTTRMVSMSKASVRNAALALLIAHQGFANPRVAQSVMAYAALMAPMNFLMTLVMKAARHRSQPAALPPERSRS